MLTKIFKTKRIVQSDAPQGFNYMYFKLEARDLTCKDFLVRK